MSKRANRVKWIDNMRGMAIIAVVVCHQMNFLHSSETVQCLTLYSVTSLVFLMGLTKGFSLSRFIKSRNKDETFLQYTIKSLLPVLSAYFVASYIILRKANIGDNQQLMISLLNYSADSPFYYVQHIIRLSVFAPVIFFTISKIFDEQNKLVRIIKLIAFLALLWIVGYFSIGVLDIFSQSYLFVYALGILCSFVSLPKPTLKLLVLDICMLLFGGYAVFRFYFARVAGNYSYSEFIDIIDPKLQMNPPNISIIIYSFACILLVYVLSDLESKFSLLKLPFGILQTMGKYSLDIFLWHLFLKNTYVEYFGIPENIVIRRVVFYLLMIGVPVVVRLLYEKMKSSIYSYYFYV